MLALFALAFGARFRLFAEHPEVTGTDGYYYVVQITDAVERGQLHVPDGSWVLWALAAAHAVVPDPILAVKASACLLAAACVPAAWWAGRALGGPAAAWAAAGWAVASPTLTHLAADFPKNLGAVPLLLVTIAALTERRWVLGAAAALLAATAHRTGAAVLGILLVASLLRLAWERPPSVFRRALPGLAGALVLFLGATLLLPNLLHPADLDRLTGATRASLWPPLPLAYARLRPTSTVELCAWFLPWLALAAAAASARVAERRALLATLAAPVAVLLFPAWDDQRLDLGYRLMLLGPALSVPLAAASLPSEWQIPRATGARALFVAMLGAPWLAWQGWTPSQDPPYRQWHRVVDAVPRPLPPLMVAHTGLSFLYDHRTGAEALPWRPEPELDRSGIERITWGIRDAEWSAAGVRDVIRVGPSRHVVPEGDWERFVAWAEEEADPDLAARIADPRNPMALRPTSLRRNH